MRAFALPIACSVLGALLVAAAPRPLEELRGFSARATRDERDWEAKLQAIPSSDSMRSYMRRLSARPHHVGSPYDKANAEWLLAQFKEWGWQAQIETFDVLFPTPRERAVELVAPTRFVATLREPPVPGDPTSGQQNEQLPTYNAYSADGDVTGPLVYVNYGVPADYEQLERVGVSVKGAIVIARYGGSWRGIKPKVAAEHGAVGCLIYSDPRDDGYRQGDVYPHGPRPGEGPSPGQVRLEHQAAVRRDRAAAGRERGGPVDHAGQSSRRLGERRAGSHLGARAAARGGARAGTARAPGVEAAAHDHLRRLGRRGAGPARLDRVGRDARGRAAAARSGLHQLRRQ